MLSLIISVKRITVDKKYGYGYLKEIMVKRVDQKEYAFVEADFPRLNQNDIEDFDGTLNKVYDKIEAILRDNRLGYGNEGMTDRKWTKKYKERTKSILEKIEKTLKER
ncbi:hypothetical protein Tco_0487345 [Tanacetum coccineum]